MPRIPARVVAGAAALLLAAVGSGCAPLGKTAVEGAPSEYRSGMLRADRGGKPVDGGTLTLGAYSEPTQLDPAEAIVSASTGGIALAALHDELMRWDPEREKVVPQLAKSLEVDENHRTWTLKLRDGVRFSDGTELDAEAVVYSLRRYVKKEADEAKLWSSNVTSMRTPDDHTVVFELARKWPSFDYLLTTGPGLIVPKSADKGGKYRPIGAGPFVFERYKPGEELVLRANEHYWGGRPHLDRFREVYLDDPHASLESFQSGKLDSVLLRDPDVVDPLLAKKTHGYLNLVALGSGAAINAQPGHPGSDPRVRRAMALAVNPELVVKRSFGGAGVVSNALYPDSSRLHPKTDPLPYDPDAARKLVEEAKADGFDGRISYVDTQDTAGRAAALALKASLEDVGFTVDLDLQRTVADQTAKISVEKDYDLGGWGISWREFGSFARMFSTLHSKGNLSVGMHTGPAMDALLEEFQRAESDREQRAVMGRIQRQWNKDVPALLYGPTPELLAWHSRVHGVVGTTNSTVLLHKAWLGSGK